MPSIVTNFKFKSNAPNFERDQVKRKSELLNAGFKDYDQGHIVYCIENNTYYSFATAKNDNGELIKDKETGYFSVFNSGNGVGSGGNDGGIYRTAFLFKSSKEQPEKPMGWVWNISLQRIQCSINPNGWTINDDKLETPVWMSIGTFNVNFPEEEQWTTPVRISGEDGRPGSDGTQLEFIYRRSYDEKSKPELPDNKIDVDDYVPVAWSDHPLGVDSTWQCEWMCQRYKHVVKDKDGQYIYDDSGMPKMEWGGWNENMDNPSPILWSKYGVMGKDGDGVEYIYNKTAENVRPDIPDQTPAFINRPEFQQDEYLPNGKFKVNGEMKFVGGWTDSPSGTDPAEPYEWVSIRKYDQETAKWGAFSIPVIWAHYGKEGFKSFVFTRSISQPATPVDGENTSYLNPIPVDPENKLIWEDGIPSSDAENAMMPVWMSSKSFFNDDSDKTRSWTVPGRMADSADFDVCYNDSEQMPSDPSKHGTQEGEGGWYDLSSQYAKNNNLDGSTAIWMATSVCKNGEWEAWTIVKIKGERGDDGTSIQILGRYNIFEDLIYDYKNGKLADGKEEHNIPTGPQIGDAYVVSVVNVDENGEWENPYNDLDYNNLVNPTDVNANVDRIKRGILFVWDGDSWVYLGEFQGDAAYVHIKYSPDSDVMNSKANGGDGVKQETWSKLYETPITPEGKTAKYIGIYSDNIINDSSDPDKYKWSKFVGEDGFGYEYIYMLSKTEEAPSIPNEKNENGLLPEDFQNHGHIPVIPEDWQDNNPNYIWWTDEPSGPNKDYPYEWMCYRTWVQGTDEWSDWKGNKNNKAILHAVWADSGFVSFAFTRTNIDLSGWNTAEELSGTYKNPLPTVKNSNGDIDDKAEPGVTSYNGSEIIWSDSIPNPTGDNQHEMVWMITAYFNLSIDGFNNHPKWSSPKFMTDTTELDVDWCPVDTNDPGNPDSNPSIWWETPYEGLSNDGKNEWPGNPDGSQYEPVWMATRKLRNGEVPVGEPWVITRIKGEKGDSGKDGTSINIMGTYDTLFDLRAAWLGEDMEEAYQDMQGRWEHNDGTLSGNNPPLVYDSYTVNYKCDNEGNILKDPITNEPIADGDLYVYTPTAYIGDEAAEGECPLGDRRMTKWVNVGKFKGDPGLPTYTHIMYSYTPLVLDAPIKPEEGSSAKSYNEYNEQIKEYNKNVNDAGGIYVDPVKIIVDEETGKEYKVVAKYIGIYTDNKFENSENASDYKWSKFTGEDGFKYEYIYYRNNEEIAPSIPDDNDLDLDDYVPEGWSDRMVGVNLENRFEWMCWRKKETDPVLGVYRWSEWIGDPINENKAVLVNFYSEKEYTTMYYIDVDPRIIKLDKYNKKDKNLIDVKVLYKKGDDVIEYEGIPEGYMILCTADGMEYQDLYHGSDPKFDVTKATGPISVGLYALDNIDGEEVGRRLDLETIPLLRDGDPNVITDLTNDSYSITCDNFGQPVTTDEVASTEFKMFYGLDQIQVNRAQVTFKAMNGNKYESTSIDVNENSTEVSKDYSDFSVNVKLDNGVAVLSVSNIDDVAKLAMNFNIKGIAVVNGKEMEGSSTFTVNKVVPGGKTPTLYQIIPSVSSLVKEDNNIDGVQATKPGTISIRLIKIQGSTDKSDESAIPNDHGTWSQLDEIPENMSIHVYIDNSTEPHASFGSGRPLNTISIETKDIDTCVEFKLTNKQDGQNDLEVHDVYIPLIKDGVSPVIHLLKPSVSAIRLSQDKNNMDTYVYSVNDVYITIQEVIGNNIKTLSNIPSGFTLRYNYDGGEYVNSDSLTIPVQSKSPQQMISVELREGDRIADVLNIPIVSDGRAGETTTIYSISASDNIIKLSDDGSGIISPANGTIYASVLQKYGENQIKNIEPDPNRPLFMVANFGNVKKYINENGEIGDNFQINNPTGPKIEYNKQVSIENCKDCLSVDFYLYKSNGAGLELIDIESIPVLKNGDNSISANLSNDMISVECDSDGRVKNGNIYVYDDSFVDIGTTTVTMYKGTTELTVKRITSTTPSGTHASINGSTVTISINKNADVVSNVQLTCTCDVDGREFSIIKTITVNKIVKGADGINATIYKIDLAPDTSSVPCDVNGNVLGGIPGTTITIYKNSDVDTGWTITSKYSYSSISGNKLSVSQLTDDITSIQIEARKDNCPTLIAVYTISKVKQGIDGKPAVVYYLRPSVSAVKVPANGQSYGTPDPSAITCAAYKRTGSDPATTDFDYELLYQSSNDGSAKSYSNSITINNSWSYIDFILKVGGTEVDRERVLIVKEGLKGADGESMQGDPGPNGPIIYPAGVWSSTTKYSHTKSGNYITASPYVYYGDKYYVLKSDKSSSKNNAPSGSSAYWQEFTQFNAIYTDILFASTALVGNAVFNGLYIFSQQGSSDNYKDFNTSGNDPYTDNNNGFKPNWCVNLSTGSMWTGGGSCKFDGNGSGYLANGKIWWTADGKLYMDPSGSITYYASDSLSGQYLQFNCSLNSGGALFSQTDYHVRGYNANGGVVYTENMTFDNDNSVAKSKTFIINASNHPTKTESLITKYDYIKRAEFRMGTSDSSNSTILSVCDLDYTFSKLTKFVLNSFKSNDNVLTLTSVECLSDIHISDAFKNGNGDAVFKGYRGGPIFTFKFNAGSTGYKSITFSNSADGKSNTQPTIRINGNPVEYGKQTNIITGAFITFTFGNALNLRPYSSIIYEPSTKQVT